MLLKDKVGFIAQLVVTGILYAALYGLFPEFITTLSLWQVSGLIFILSTYSTLCTNVAFIAKQLNARA